MKLLVNSYVHIQPFPILRDLLEKTENNVCTQLFLLEINIL